MTEPRFIPLSAYREYPVEEMKERAAAFNADMQCRRTVRHFADRQLPRQIIEDRLRAAGSAPSGANMQPWHFVIISDPEIKRRIREGAEKEENEFYHHRAPREWLDVLRALGTDEHKPFLETAPYLIAIFVKSYDIGPDGRRIKHYYATESVGLATGILIAAVHNAGLVSLTHTPSPMGFLNEILGRPPNERPFLLLVVGFPTDDATVPDISRKPLDAISSFV